MPTGSPYLAAHLTVLIEGFLGSRVVAACIAGKEYVNQQGILHER